MSVKLLDDKMSDIAATGARYVTTSNPGCMAQLEAGVLRKSLDVQVSHPVELLDRAYRSS
jgi:glycolate oxidase iron-sulfur subunit